LYDDESYDNLKAIWANPKGEVFRYDTEEDSDAKKSFEEFCGLSSGIANFEWDDCSTAAPSESGEPLLEFVYELASASSSWELRQNIIAKEFDILTKEEESQFSSLIQDAQLAELKSWVDLDTMEIV